MPEKIKLVNPVNGYGNKITVIKAIRIISDNGLKEAKDMCEAMLPQTMSIGHRHLDINGDLTPQGRFDVMESMRLIRLEGGNIGPSIHEMLTELRELAKRALEQHEDELADEILQLVLAEKLRRKDTF